MVGFPMEVRRSPGPPWSTRLHACEEVVPARPGWSLGRPEADPQDAADAEEIFCDIITPGFKFMNIQAMYNFHQLSSLQPSTIDCHLWLILASCTFYHGQVSWTRKLSPRA